jgi:hypothetical protein
VLGGDFLVLSLVADILYVKLSPRLQS